MHGVRERVLLRHLLEQGQTIAAAARQLGVHRATVHRWIEAGLLDTDVDQIQAQYAARPPVPQLLDPYKPVIAARLAEFPALSASRLFDEVRAAGYAGGYTRLRDYVRSIRPAVPAEPLVRFETPPGHQATRRRSTLPTAACRGACATRWSSCSASRGCSGSGSIRGRISGRCCMGWRPVSARGAAPRRSGSSIRCEASSRAMIALRAGGSSTMPSSSGSVGITP